MDQISKTEVSHLADLARLVLDENQKERLAGNLSQVVSYIEQIGEIEMSDSDHTKEDISAVGVTGLKNIVADDEPRSLDDQCQIDTKKALADAPNSEDNYFKVRAVME